MLKTQLFSVSNFSEEGIYFNFFYLNSESEEDKYNNSYIN